MDLGELENKKEDAFNQSDIQRKSDRQSEDSFRNNSIA